MIYRLPKSIWLDDVKYPLKMTTDFLTTSQAATIIGVSQKMVQSLIKRGRLPAEKIGRIWVVRREDAENHERGKGGRPPTAQRA